MAIRSFSFLLLSITVIFSFFSCDDPYLSTNLVPHTIDPVYIENVDSDSMEILVIGDSGSGKDGQFAVASWIKTYITDNPVTFSIMCGDNYYENGVASVNDPLFETRFELIYDDNLSDIPFYPVLGNHDFRGNIDAQIVYTERNTHWEMPYLYYNYIYYLNDNTKLQFIAIDSTIIVTENPMAHDQKAWFEDVLAESDADWTIVYAHHPLYSNGNHGDNRIMIDEIKPLLEKFGVDIYISGHDHDLQVLQPQNGVHYFVSGAAGKRRATNIAENTMYANGTLGFMTLKISKDTIIARVIIDDAFIDYETVINR